MNYEDVRTRFATYECLRLSRETRFIPNDAPVLLEVDILASQSICHHRGNVSVSH